MVLILSLLDKMNPENGQAKYEEVQQHFLAFYKKREAQQLVIDAPLQEMTSWQEATVGQINMVLESPIIALRSVLSREKRQNGDIIGFRPDVWPLMNSEVVKELREYANRELEAELNKMQSNITISLTNAFSKILDTEQALSEIVSEIIEDHHVRDTLSSIKNYIVSRGFSYPSHLIENFYLSLKAKPFVILAGISGTGKTKLVKLFAESLGATIDNGQFTLIPVRPDWSDPSDLIGYKDLSGIFQPGALTKVLLEASKQGNQTKPYFICLDEMNLARVEHYFSDLLSLMETQEWEEDEEGKRIVTSNVISTSSLKAEDRIQYSNLCIPENVYIIGTVNMDETTHPFSKKVLDRANTIEFNYIDLDNLADLENFEDERPEPLSNVHQTFLRGDYLSLQEAIAYKDLIKETTAKLTKINQILETIHAHVGFRIRDAISFYMIYNQRFDLLDEDAAFDIQLCQKILPRIQGSSTAVQKTLVHLLDFATNKDFALGTKETLRPNDLYEENSLLSKVIQRKATEQLQNALYPESAKKIAYMLRRLEEDGFTSFWLS